jgi:outer membrane protein insertion porin family
MVKPEPRLQSYTFTGIRGRHRDDLEDQVPLLSGSPVRPGDIERTEQVIREFYREKGYLNTTVDVERTTTEQNYLQLTFNVDRKEKVEVEDITFEGNEVFSDGKLRGQMGETKENRWWRFWKGETFKEDGYEEDLQRVIDFYREEGYYDAQIVKDSIYLASDDALNVNVTVQEGQRYHIRNIEWDGNTVFPDRVLTQTLGLEEGDPYNGKQLEENLLGNRRSSDVSSLYMDRGYMRFNAQPNIRVVGGDSLDITFDVMEGDVYDFGQIQITGNNKTKEHVIRRELYTVPGETFSRSAIQESIRRLMQLSYFSQESLAGGPDVSIDEEEQEVDLTYSVEEVGSDQLELSGTWGIYGLVLQLGFKFNNFSAQNLFNGSAWRPLPSGDGQKLGVNVRTNGSYFQSYSLSFTEPWFRGKPNPVGGSVSYSRFSRFPQRSFRTGQIVTRGDAGTYTRISSEIFSERRLQWPDDKFNWSTALGYQYYNNAPDPETGNTLIRYLPRGVSQQVTVRQALTRNSLDNPMFPSRGSRLQLSVELAPPLGDLVQYHKWRFKTNWNVPLGGDFSIGVSSDYGYIGSITGEDVRFQRFELGGSPFDYGGYNYGTDPVFMRGYPARALGPREERGGDFQSVGGRILTKYTSELRWKAVSSQQLQAAPYLFLDAGNTWSSFQTFNPSQLYRSAGVGVKLFLPIVGMIEFNYGYNFDTFDPIQSNETGEPGWRFQFSLGQGFGGN